MSWKNILKEDVMLELEELIGEEGNLEDIMKMINGKFGVKSKLLYSSSSRPVLGFDLPIFVRCEMGTKDRPNETEEFTVRDVSINTSEIR